MKTLDELEEKYRRLTIRHRSRENDPALTLSAEQSMIRLEHLREQVMNNDGERSTNCATCGEEIDPRRLEAMPETVWCKACVEAHDRKTRKPWALK